MLSNSKLSRYEYEYFREFMFNMQSTSCIMPIELQPAGSLAVVYCVRLRNQK